MPRSRGEAVRERADLGHESRPSCACGALVPAGDDTVPVMSASAARTQWLPTSIPTTQPDSGFRL